MWVCWDGQFPVKGSSPRLQGAPRGPFPVPLPPGLALEARCKPVKPGFRLSPVLGQDQTQGPNSPPEKDPRDTGKSHPPQASALSPSNSEVTCQDNLTPQSKCQNASGGRDSRHIIGGGTPST